LFAALQLGSAAERAAFLDSACAGDAELRRQVDKLLQAHANVGDFLNKPVVEQLVVTPEQSDRSDVTTDHGAGAASSNGAHPAGDAAGSLPVVPGYRVLGEIARGSMGAVLRGRDVDLDRDLAVKVLLERHASRPEMAQRFIKEAQIGGRFRT
jgi:serine/threonine protein kinase